MTRQLFDMKTGARRGPWAELMKPVVANMSVQDMTVVAAFAASVQPPAAARSTTTSAAR
jgi:cytochrome c553